MAMNFGIVFLGMVLHSFTGTFPYAQKMSPFDFLRSGQPPVVPLDDDKWTVDFYLFTNKDALKSIPLTTENAHLLKDAQQVVFILHGWLQDHQTYLFPNLRNAYLGRKDTKYHVIEVDWSSLSKNPYPLASTKAPLIGKTIAKFITNIMEKHKLPLDKFEFTGHSLGAQISGFVGQELRESLGRKLRRVTALDPAGPGFVMKPEHDRLSPDDAEVVVVIHTDGLALGYFHPCGTVDVYVNGGNAPQAGCPDDDIQPVTGCGHERSIKYYTEAVRSGKFHAVKCNSYNDFIEGKCDKNKRVNIGRDVAKEDHGDFYVSTNPEPPFAKD